MSGAGPVDRFILAFFGVLGFNGKRSHPVLPVFVFDEYGDGSADGLRVPNAGDDVNAIGFNLHASAPPEALLPPPELPVQVLDTDWDSSRKAGQSSDKTRPVRFPRCLKTQHLYDFHG